MNKILVGTGNPAKLADYKKFLKDFNLEIVSAASLNIPEPEENAANCEEESIKKAKYYFEKSGIPTIVDDGGFEIEALNGQPGNKAKRWIGRDMTDEEIIAEVFKRMQGQANRKARHVVALAIATPFGIFTSHGYFEGVIPDKPSSKIEPRFPYRSILYLPNYHKYWGELSEEEDKILSHRNHAIEKLKDILIELSK
jgi:XTP/dITP diphosphohydrolase